MNIDKKTIIMADDSLTNLTIGFNALEQHYNIITVNSGARLLKTLEKKIPDLILLDVDMPEMSGFETIALLKKNKEYADIPVIFLTAKDDTASELEGLSLGAADYITKPFSPALLHKRIELHLLLESRERELKLQNAILGALIDLVESRDYATGGHIADAYYALVGEVKCPYL